MKESIVVFLYKSTGEFLGMNQDTFTFFFERIGKQSKLKAACLSLVLVNVKSEFSRAKVFLDLTYGVKSNPRESSRSAVLNLEKVFCPLRLHDYIRLSV